MRKYALKRAKTKLYDAIEQFTNLDDLLYPDPRDPRFNITALDYWLKNDSVLRNTADGFFQEIRAMINQSLEVTEKKEKEEKATKTDTENSFERPLKSRNDDLISENTSFWNLLEEL